MAGRGGVGRSLVLIALGALAVVYVFPRDVISPLVR